jgi:hypothetical protein
MLLTSTSQKANYLSKIFFVNDTTNVNKDKKKLRSRDLALCVVLKDEPDLIEWLTYHLAIGFGKIYVIDNNSSMHVTSVIHHYIRWGLVEYRYVPRPNFEGLLNDQMYSYQLCIREFSSYHVFMGFIDADEYIVLRNNRTISQTLEKFRLFGGLTLNTMVFGSSGHISRPIGGLLKNYYKCFPDNHVKTIVNTQFVTEPSGNPHSFLYKPGYFAVDVRFKKVDIAFNPYLNIRPHPYLFDVVYLNHYTLKSFEEYKAKVLKGAADGLHRYMANFYDFDSRAKRNCSLLQIPSSSNRI